MRHYCCSSSLIAITNVLKSRSRVPLFVYRRDILSDNTSFESRIMQQSFIVIRIVAKREFLAFEF